MTGDCRAWRNYDNLWRCIAHFGGNLRIRPGFGGVKAACAVRDLQGRARLVLKMDEKGASLDMTKLKDDLTKAMGGYFKPPILSTLDKKEGARIASILIDKAQKWDDAFFRDLEGKRIEATKGKWSKIERRLSSRYGWRSHHNRPGNLMRALRLSLSVLSKVVWDGARRCYRALGSWHAEPRCASQACRVN